jgi:hypothetical protein
MSHENKGYWDQISKLTAERNELATVLRGICNAYDNADYDLCYSRIEDADEVLEKYEDEL